MKYGRFVNPSMRLRAQLALLGVALAIVVAVSRGGLQKMFVFTALWLAVLAISPVTIRLARWFRG